MGAAPSREPARDVVIELTKKDGTVAEKAFAAASTTIPLFGRDLVGVSDSVAQLTLVTSLNLDWNAFAEMPAGAMAMTQLADLTLLGNRLVALPPEIGRLQALVRLNLALNRLATLPREIGQLQKLCVLTLHGNALVSLPSEIGLLQQLVDLALTKNQLSWLPVSLDRLPLTTNIYLNDNPLPSYVGLADSFQNMRRKLGDVFAATTWPTIASIREPASDLLIGLQDLELPALVTLEIVDAAFPNAIAMHKKWDLIVAVKHFRRDEP